LLKKKKFNYFYPAGLPLFACFTAFLVFYRRSSAALDTTSFCLRRRIAALQRFLFVWFLAALKKRICSPTYFLSQEAIRGWFARAPLTQQKRKK
jgi:hypothetical protein